MMGNLYQWKDILLAIFKLVDTNNSGSINRQEFTEIIRFLMHHQNIGYSDLDSYVDELTDAMDSDRNGRIDFNEFFGKNKTYIYQMKYSLISLILEGFRLVSVK